MQGVSTESDIQTSDMKRITEIIKSFSIPSIFVESTINPKLFQQITQDAKINLAGPLFSDSLGDEKSVANTYINLLKANTDMIVDGLTMATKEASPSKNKDLWLYGFISLMMIMGWLLFYFNIKS
jgi:ABC-type Zn uptake system ZnuABC Zn-binding protein ZnuA